MIQYTVMEKSVQEVSLFTIQQLVLNLNTSLLELKETEGVYKIQINECKDLCAQMRELLDATTARIKPGESQLSY